MTRHGRSRRCGQNNEFDIGDGPALFSALRSREEGCRSFCFFCKVGRRADPAAMFISHIPNLNVPCWNWLVPNGLHRYYGAGYVHFITTSCYQRMPVLAKPTPEPPLKDRDAAPRGSPAAEAAFTLRDFTARLKSRPFKASSRSTLLPQALHEERKAELRAPILPTLSAPQRIQFQNRNLSDCERYRQHGRSHRPMSQTRFPSPRLAAD